MRSLRTGLKGSALGSLAVLGMAAVVASPGAASAAPAGFRGWGPLVRVADGILLGTVNASTRQFLDIPYAAPPTGNLRFWPPQPAAPWPSIRNATQAGPVCPQLGAFNESEDCLTLNVYTPASPPARTSPAVRSRHRPVMVWFYGGGYFEGSASGYDPTPLVTKGNVIVVTVNYRVGAFGFLALPGLDAESRTTGNYGILDQQASLRSDLTATIPVLASYGGNQDIPALEAAYPPASSTDADLALSSVYTDGIFSCSALYIAQDMAAQPGGRCTSTSSPIPDRPARASTR